MFGAQGGGNLGGPGGEANATIAVTPGETFHINVGGRGSVGLNGAGGSGSGGANGGGNGGSSSNGGSSGGGGASDVRLGAFGLADRVIVAGGGGGPGGGADGLAGSGGAGGAGGGASGSAGLAGSSGCTGGAGATGGFASPGGVGTIELGSVADGGAGVAGTGGNGGGGVNSGGGGGGGGWFGGGGGGGGGTSQSSCGGGGGSSHTPDGTGLTQGVRGGDGYVTIVFTPATVPGSPAIGTATAGNGSAGVAFTPPGSDGGSAITGYTATSSPGGVTASGTSSPITVTGLTNSTAYTFTVHATNAVGNSPESQASNPVTPGSPPTLVNATPPATATVGVAYSYTYTATGNPAPGFFVVGATALPPGLTLDHTTGILSGTPTSSGTFSFSVAAINAAGSSPPVAAQIVVNPALAAPVFTNDTPPATATQGVAYSYTYTATGNPAPSFAVAGGALPPGLSLNATTGVLSGTPTTAGTSTFTFTVSAANGVAPDAVSPSTNITVNPVPPTLVNATPPATATVGVAYSYTYTATGNPAPAFFAVGATALPPGLTLDHTTGILSGTPTSSGTFSFSVAAINAAGSSPPVAAQIVVNPAPIPIPVTVTGAQTYGSSTPAFAYTPAAGVTGTAVCTKLTTGAAIGSSLSGGSYIIDGTTCSGLTASDANHSVTYRGGAFTVTPAGTSVQYTGAQTVAIGSSFTPAATVSSPVAGCLGGQPVTFSLDATPDHRRRGQLCAGDGPHRHRRCDLYCRLGRRGLHPDRRLNWYVVVCRLVLSGHPNRGEPRRLGQRGRMVQPVRFGPQ